MSPYLEKPLRSLDQARASPVVKRYYVSGYDGGNWETLPSWAPTAALALAQAQERAAGTAFRPTEVDPIPDAMVIGDTVIPIERPNGRGIALAQS